MNRFGQDIRMYYIKGSAVNTIISAIQDNWLEAVESIASNIKRFKIKKN